MIGSHESANQSLRGIAFDTIWMAKIKISVFSENVNQRKLLHWCWLVIGVAALGKSWKLSCEAVHGYFHAGTMSFQESNQRYILP